MTDSDPFCHRALSVLVTVGETDEWLGGIIERAKKLKMGNGFAEGVDMYVSPKNPTSYITASVLKQDPLYSSHGHL